MKDEERQYNPASGDTSRIQLQHDPFLFQLDVRFAQISSQSTNTSLTPMKTIKMQRRLHGLPRGDLGGKNLEMQQQFTYKQCHEGPLAGTTTPNTAKISQPTQAGERLIAVTTLKRATWTAPGTGEWL
jgi:hypothetical protein